MKLLSRISFLLFLSSLSASAQSASTPIFNLPTGTGAAGTNYIAVLKRPNQTNGTEKVPLVDIGITDQTLYAQPGDNLYQVKTNAVARGIPNIVVTPGTYTNGVTNLWFSGNWFFQNNPLLRLIDIPTNTTGAGMFDDRFSGAVTCSVHGSLRMEYHSGTNVAVNPVDCTLSYNTNSLGPIVQTNPATYIRWDADTLLGLCGQTPVPFAITTLHGVSNSYYRKFEIYNLNPNNVAIITTNCPADPNTVYSISTGCSGIHWGENDVLIEANIRPMTVQAVWGDNLTTNGGQMWISGKVCDGKWYLVGRTNTWKVWGDYDELACSQDTTDHILIDIWNSGSHYFHAKKISSLGMPVTMQNPDTGQKDTNLVVWVDFDKCSGSNGWLNVKHGALRGRIGHFEQNGPNNGGSMVTVTNISANLDISGEAMFSANVAVTHGSGSSVLHNYRIYTTNRDPILINGSGFHLHNNVVVTPATATNSIRSAGAQTVGAYGLNMLRSNAHANITFSTGTTNVTVSNTID